MKQSLLNKLKSKWQTALSKQNNPKKQTVLKELPIWLKNDLTREEAENYLMDKEIGVFLIRQSETIKDCYVLSIKVAKYINMSEISHYIIIKSRENCFKIRGFVKEFNDLKSLVTHCSFIRDMLPVLLNLDFYRNEIKFGKQNQDDYFYYRIASTNSSMASASSMDSLSSQTSMN
jgi:hypothetical protein